LGAKARNEFDPWGLPLGVWTEAPGYSNHWVIRGRDCTIWFAPRPSYCDRGNWLATIETRNPLELDHADGWSPGRYYFDLAAAKSEIEAWLRKRGQLIPK
jgi:hypothetical protein